MIDEERQQRIEGFVSSEEVQKLVPDDPGVLRLLHSHIHVYYEIVVESRRVEYPRL